MKIPFGILGLDNRVIESRFYPPRGPHNKAGVSCHQLVVLPKGPATVRLRKGADMFLYDSCKKAHGEGKRKH